MRNIVSIDYFTQGHTEQAFSLDWSQSGQLIASVCKDGRIRIYEPLGATGCTPKLEGGDIVVKKGARVVWVLEDQYLIVTGFSRLYILYVTLIYICGVSSNDN